MVSISRRPHDESSVETFSITEFAKLSMNSCRFFLSQDRKTPQMRIGLDFVSQIDFEFFRQRLQNLFFLRTKL